MKVKVIMNKVFKLITAVCLVSSAAGAMEQIDVLETPFFKIQNKTGQDHYACDVPGVLEGKYSDFRVRVVFNKGQGLDFIREYAQMLNKIELPNEDKECSFMAPVSTIYGGVSNPETQFITAYTTCTGSAIGPKGPVQMPIFVGESTIDLGGLTHVTDVRVNFKGVDEGTLAPNVSFVVDKLKYDQASGHSNRKMKSISYLKPFAYGN